MKFSLNVIFMPKSVTVSKMCHCKQRDFSTNGLGIAKTVTVNAGRPVLSRIVGILSNS